MRKFVGFYDEWKRMYAEDGCTPRQIAERFGASLPRVKCVLREAGLNYRNNLHVIHAEAEKHVGEWRALYASGKTFEEIGVAFGVTGNTVRRLLTMEGVKPRSRSDVARKHRLGNERAFRRIDTPEKAYWLGFLMADGTVKNGVGKHAKRPYASYVLLLGLAVADWDHIERFRQFMQSDAPIRLVEQKRKGRRSTWNGHFNVCSKQTAGDLVKAGCVPNKTLIAQFPAKTVPSELLRHFVRGFFDGDGCIYLHKPGPTGARKAKIDWTCASIYFLFGLEIALAQAGIVGCSMRYPPNTEAKHLLLARKPEIAKLYHWMYDGATVYLPRKKAKFEELLGINQPTEGAV